MTAGRPTKYNKVILANANDYVDNYADHEHVIPSIVGMARVLKVSQKTLYNWSEAHPEFAAVMEDCNDYQEFTLINKGLKNEINAQITKLALGKHGYSDKQETDSVNRHIIGYEEETI